MGDTRSCLYVDDGNDLVGRETAVTKSGGKKKGIL